MKRKKAPSISVTRNRGRRMTGFSLLFIVLIVLNISLTLNLFFLKTVTIPDGKGRAEYQLNGIFDIPMPFSSIPATTLLTFIGVLLLSLLTLTAMGGANRAIENNSIDETVGLIAFGIGLILTIVSFIAGFFISVGSVGETLDNDVFENIVFESVLEQEYKSQDKSSIYVFSPSSIENGSKDKFIEKLLDKKEQTTPTPDQDLIDGIEERKAGEKSSNPSYTYFKIVEVQKGEFHLFSYDSERNIERASDVVDLGELTSENSQEFESLVILARS